MSLINDGSGMYMPVAPAYAGGNNCGFGNCGDGWWVILFLFALMGNGFGGWGGNNEVLPYLWNQNTSDAVNSRFDAAGITNQLSNLQNTVSNGFAGVEVSACNKAMDAMQTAHNAEVTQLQQSFAVQTQLAQCCCENRQAIAQLGADLAREACADRQAVADGVQAILTQMCNDKLDAKNEKIVELQNQINIANLRASQIDQTAQILSDNAKQTVALEQYLNPTPVPAYVVQNPNCCQNNSGCGCGGFYN